MALLIEGKFKDLYQYSDTLYARISELTIKRNLGIIEVELDFFMNPESASKYKVNSIKSLNSTIEIKVDDEHLPVNLQHLQYLKNGEWLPAGLQHRYVLLTYTEDTETFEIPTFDLEEEIQPIIDFDANGNQLLTNKLIKKPIKRVHSTRERLIYKINQQLMNQPYEWVYLQMYQLFAETFNEYQIKNI